MPGKKIIPASFAQASQALTFKALLWSVTAMASRPLIKDIFIILLGVISLSPQGDNAE